MFIFYFIWFSIRNIYTYVYIYIYIYSKTYIHIQYSSIVINHLQCQIMSSKLLQACFLTYCTRVKGTKSASVSWWHCRKRLKAHNRGKQDLHYLFLPSFCGINKLFLSGKCSGGILSFYFYNNSARCARAFSFFQVQGHYHCKL